VNAVEEANCQSRFYSRRECRDSDHRPVVAYYSVVSKKIDKVRFEEVKRDYFDVT
jgi:hypothetical protein